ncbi:hypothetical protein PTKIN_Ptkin09bG0128400 [Pterospermum kingtungense]
MALKGKCIDMDGSCRVCGSCEATSFHIFFSCPLAVAVWGRTFPGFLLEWCTPCEGCIKVNVDAAYWENSNEASIVAVARDFRGHILVSAAKFCSTIDSVLHA